MAIVKMKKISLVLFDKYRDESLSRLRDAGVLHIEKLEGKGEEYEQLYTLNEKFKNALALLNSDIDTEDRDYQNIEEASACADEVFDKIDEIKRITDSINSISKEVERLQPLGDFDPGIIKTLSEKGIGITVLDVNKSDSGLFEDVKAFKIAETKSRDYYAVVGEIDPELESIEHFMIPEKGLTALIDEKENLKEELAKSEEDLKAFASYRKLLKKAIDETSTDLDFEVVRSGINVDEKLSYLTGFCPVPSLEKLTAEAREHGWGLLIEEPDEEDEVPTQLKLGKFASLLEPVTDFLGILPGYREYDISFFFLCFFSIFTAMLIGDAGYGTLFLTITVAGMIIFGTKTGKVPKAFFLLLLLSVTTIIYGAVSGTWFASKAIMKISFIDSLKLDVFRVDTDAQISLVMGISFFLGIVQLLIGVVQNFRKNFPKLSSFAQIGWFAVLVAIYYLVITLVVKREGLETYPQPMLYVLLGGVVLIFIFGAQEEGKSFIKGIISSLTNFLQLFLDVVGTFSDIMSYVRLFAVGLASVKIAETFNQLGDQMSDGPIIIFGIIVVILGHTINIVLGLMAILVHAVRLNILEYSGKVGVEWSGFKYEPFKINKEK